MPRYGKKPNWKKPISEYPSNVQAMLKGQIKYHKCARKQECSGTANKMNEALKKKVEKAEARADKAEKKLKEMKAQPATREKVKKTETQEAKEIKPKLKAVSAQKITTKKEPQEAKEIKKRKNKLGKEDITVKERNEERKKNIPNEDWASIRREGQFYFLDIRPKLKEWMTKIYEELDKDIEKAKYQEDYKDISTKLKKKIKSIKKYLPKKIDDSTGEDELYTTMEDKLSDKFKKRKLPDKFDD